MGDDAWTVVGGKGQKVKGKKGGGGTNKPHDAGPSVELPPAGPPPDDPPGWGAGPSAAPPRTQRGQRGNKGKDETMEERVERLGAVVEACRLELRTSQVYSSLVNAIERCGRELQAREVVQAAAAATTTGTPAAAEGSNACSSGGGSPSADAVMETGAFGMRGMLAALGDACGGNGAARVEAGVGCSASSTAAGSEAAGSGTESESVAGAAIGAAIGTAGGACGPQLPWHHGIRDLVIYGLGSPEDSRVARYQLALGLLLMELLPGLEGQPQTFDPCFEDADLTLLARLGMGVITENEGGARRASRPTLFYMPHCEHMLYEALLSTNEAACTLHNVTVLGNSLQAYEDAWGLRPAHTPNRPATLLSLVASGRVAEAGVRAGDAAEQGAFNNMALHGFARA
ncbi:hypothetical protein FOA52_001901 [Chlamydomonas sp. UWO 241]|nr:hypothetical protein FOA52_001901 [Chlamydomonas sp. UWO 241]